MVWLMLTFLMLWMYSDGERSEQQFYLNAKLSDLHTISNLMQHTLCITDLENQRKYLSSVAALMRYGFDVQKAGFSTLERELLHCRELMNTYTLLSGHECKFNVIGEAEHAQRIIPGLSLICLLENALQHGRKQGVPLVIHLEISMHRRKLCFAFSGYELPDAKTLERAPNGHGLHFLKQRIDYCYVKLNRAFDRQRLLVRNNQLQLNIPV